MKQFIEIGKIINTHGVKGAIKVEPWCDSPSVLSKMKRVYFAPKNSGDGFKETAVLSGSVQKDKVLLALDGIDTVDAAIALKNTVIYANREDIPIKEGSFLIADLIGLDVIDANSGRVYGRLTDVIQGGSGDIYDIKTENGSALMPAVKEFVEEIKLDSGIYSTPTIEHFVNNLSLMLKDIGTLHFSKNASILLYQLLIEIRENLNNTNYIKQRSKLLDAINYIERNYASPIEISHVAELSNMTPEHFCRLFKERYNMRPVEYIKKLRLQEAKNKLISNPAMSISEISESVGYNSPSYFIKLFKELEGTTPICFRNSILNLEPPPET